MSEHGKTTALPALHGHTSIAWGTFDPDWYYKAYRPDGGALREGGKEQLLAHYRTDGARLGHSPNRFFDEAWYRLTLDAFSPNIDSGFAHYCRTGLTEQSPHWLFDEAFYRQRYPQLSDSVLSTNGFANGYDHFLKHGSAEGRIGHLFFDPAVYQALLSPEEAAAALAEGPFGHYLRCLEAARPEVRTSAYFDPQWYLDTYKTVAAAVQRGEFLGALHHYLTNSTPCAFDPLPDFCDKHYLARYPDLAAAVEAKDFRNGYQHFLQHGVFEARSPGPDIDLGYYGSLPQVERDLQDERARDAFAHFLLIGRDAGLSALRPLEQPVDEWQAKTLFRREARNLLPLLGRRTLDFTCTGAPAVSVVMVLHNQFEMTLASLNSVRAGYPGDIELVLVDSGSTDETRSIESYVLGAKIAHLPTNVGFVLGCNRGIGLAVAERVLLLNNDIRLEPDAIAAALRRMHSDPGIGAVGGKVIRAHGLLQEAGNIIWRDGTTSGYLRDASPLAPEANFVRTVDFCSGVFLLVDGALLRRLGGLDEAFAPAYYEESDLCVRITAAGYRVVYDPAIVIYHHEYGSAAPSDAAGPVIERNQQTFFHKHAALLQSRRMPAEDAAVHARSPDAGQTRVLFIEDLVPLRHIGSGFVRSNDIVRAMASLGYQVTVFPINGCGFSLAAVYADMPDTVEVMHDRAIGDLAALLAERAGYYDVIWIARTHNLARCRPFLERVIQGDGRVRRIVLDTEAIAAEREAVRRRLEGDAFDCAAALRAEFAQADMCQTIVAVSDDEAQTVRQLGYGGVTVLGHMRVPEPTTAVFSARMDLLFVGAIHRQDSPNYDGLCWFVDAVLPLVRRTLDVRLTVAGYVGEAVSLERFRDCPGVALRGPMGDLRPLYHSHRVFVAPTRYAAGAPFKVYEAASFGVPVVATSLLGRQMGWRDGEALLTAEATDPAGFAARILRLYQDEPLWQRVRAAALQRLEIENGFQNYAATIRRIVAG